MMAAGERRDERDGENAHEQEWLRHAAPVVSTSTRTQPNDKPDVRHTRTIAMRRITARLPLPTHSATPERSQERPLYG